MKQLKNYNYDKRTQVNIINEIKYKMKLESRTKLALMAGAAVTGLIAGEIASVVDKKVNGAYESAIKFFNRHPKLRENPIGNCIERTLCENYVSRTLDNMNYKI